MAGGAIPKSSRGTPNSCLREHKQIYLNPPPNQDLVYLVAVDSLSYKADEKTECKDGTGRDVYLRRKTTSWAFRALLGVL